MQTTRGQLQAGARRVLAEVALYLVLYAVVMTVVRATGWDLLPVLLVVFITGRYVFGRTWPSLRRARARRSESARPEPSAPPAPLADGTPVPGEPGHRRA